MWISLRRQGESRPGSPSRISHDRWVEHYSVMAATPAARFPEKAPELFAYQAQIIRAKRNYEPGRLVVYDRQFRREALVRKDLNWSVTDPGSIVKLLLEGLGRSRGATTVCRTTTRHSTAHGTQTIRGRPGPKKQPHPGLGYPIHPGANQQPPDSDPWLNSAVASMKAGVSWHAATTPMPARTAAVRIQGCHAHRQCRHEQGHPFGPSSQ